MPPLLLTCHTLKISHHISCFVLTTFRHHVVTWELDLQLSLPSIYITAFNNRLLDNEQALHFIHFSQLKDALPLYFLVTKTFYICYLSKHFLHDPQTCHTRHTLLKALAVFQVGQSSMVQMCTGEMPAARSLTTCLPSCPVYLCIE
jgi:hypothetical protein